MNGNYSHTNWLCKVAPVKHSEGCVKVFLKEAMRRNGLALKWVPLHGHCQLMITSVKAKEASLFMVIEMQLMLVLKRTLNATEILHFINNQRPY